MCRCISRSDGERSYNATAHSPGTIIIRLVVRSVGRSFGRSFGRSVGRSLELLLPSPEMMGWISLQSKILHGQTK